MTVGDPAGESKCGDAAAKTAALYAEWSSMAPSLWDHPSLRYNVVPPANPAPARFAGPIKWATAGFLLFFCLLL